MNVLSPPPPHALAAMVAVVVLLLIASAARALLERRRPHADHAELRQRIRSWWWMIALLFAALVSHRYVAVGFFAALSALALREFLRNVALPTIAPRAALWAYLAIPIQYYWVAAEWYGMFIVFVPVYVFLLLPLRAVLSGDTDGFIRAAGTLHWAVMLTVFSLSHIAYLLSLPVRNAAAGAVGLVLFLLFITQFNDVCQYLWGKRFGRRRIAPRVSPNKTWAGFVGGLATVTVCAALLAPLLTPLSVVQGLLAGLLIGVGGFVGDLVVSAVKRDLRIKDSGRLIPGHGGVLDRLDSLTYAAPLFFHYVYYIAYRLHRLLRC